MDNFIKGDTQLIKDLVEQNNQLKQQLAEERKKVVQEAKKLVVEATCYDTEEDARKYLYELSSTQVLEILDQIERGV